MSKSLFERLFPNDGFHWGACKQLVSELSPQQGRILDLGCGDNDVLSMLRTPGREVWGTDFVVHTKLKHPEWFRQMTPGSPIPFDDNSFELVTCFAVLEHVADPDAFLSEIRRVLRPGGHFIAHSISGSHYVTWIRRMFDLFPHSFTQWLVMRLYGRAEEDTYPTHYRLNRLGEIERVARRHNLEVARFNRYADQGYFRFLSPLVPVATVVDWLLEKIAAGWGRIYFTVTLRAVPHQEAEGRQAVPDRNNQH